SMSSDSSSESNSSSEDRRRKRKHKKHDKDVDKKPKKSKKSKREKRRKENKRCRRDEPKEQPTAYTAPARQLTEPVDNDDAFGPALPPHLLKQPQATTMIGPLMPSNMADALEAESVAAVHSKDNEDDDDEMGSFGPLPHATQVELEERALTLKLAALQGDSLNGSATDQDVREEWMLELPEVGLKGGLAALNNMKRTFYQGKERPDFSDRSSWTKTPQSAAAGPKPCSSKDMEQAAQAKYERQRDDEQEQIAKKHKKKHKRDESLVELHQKKLRKEQREREKELAVAGAKPERRPFSRDVDLKLNKIDKNQTKQIVDKAKILNTKFSSGQAKYL
ncbi:hypothetical protein KR093_009573, partial [Drosophila rubida]